LEKIERDGGIFRQRFNRERDMLGKCFLVRILQILRETADEFLQALGERLRSGEEIARGERLARGEKEMLLGESETIGEARVVRADDGLRDAGRDERGAKLGLAGDVKMERPRRAAGVWSKWRR